MRKKRILKLLLAGIGIACVFAGCEPDGADIGNLYGRWHLESIESAQGPVVHNDTIFLSFQGTAYQYLVGWGHFDWGSYRKTADSLVLNPLAYGGNFIDIGIVPDPKRQPTGFALQKLNNHDLIISRHDTVWSFSKFLD